MIDDSLWDEVAGMKDSRAIRVRVAVANLVGALLVGLQTTVLSRPAAREDTSQFRRDVAISVAVSVVFAVVAGVAADALARRRADRSFGWSGERRPPTPEEQVACLRYPWLQSLEFLAWWLLGAVLLGGLQVAYGNSTTYAIRTGVSVALGGLTAAGVSFLLLERFNRPAFALALAGKPPPEGVVFGLGRRFVLTWALAAGVPLVLVGTAPIGLTTGQRAGLGVSIAVVSGLGLLAGLAVTTAAARSVVEPLTEVRVAQRRIEEGDLDVEVRVDDGGDIGLLQAGFNRMAEGLRERQRLHDLFGRHVGVDVAREALARGVQLGGELRAASVLFVDLIGSTAMAQRLPPEEVVALLNEVFGCVVRCTTAEGGWVNKFEGDAALCIFGPPGNMSGHQTAALRAARSLHGALGALRSHHPDLDAGIGVSTGNVVAGNVGSEDRYEYTVIGDPVNEAARLTEQAKVVTERVLASRTSVKAADPDEAAQWRRHGSFELRGRAAPTEAYVPS